MDIKQIEDKLIEALKAGIPYLKTVMPYNGDPKDISSLPVRYPAALVIYGGSEYKWLCGPEHKEKMAFSVIALTKGDAVIGNTSFESIVKGIYDVLTNSDLGADIQKIAPVKVSSIKFSGQVRAYRMDFVTAFKRETEGQAAIKCCYVNILESSTVTLSQGTEDPSYPLYRLYDRNIGRAFKASAASTIAIKIDQGATGPYPSVDRLIIPAGHNLSGMTLDLMHSDDDITYTPVIPQWIQPDSGSIEKSWAAASRRYWKFIISNPSSAPLMTELFLTSTFEWDSNPSAPEGPLEDILNVEADATSGGQDRRLVYGDPKRRRKYAVNDCGPEMQEAIKALYGHGGGGSSFFLSDRDGVWIFGGLKGPLNLKETGHLTYGFEFDFLETLP